MAKVWKRYLVALLAICLAPVIVMPFSMLFSSVMVSAGIWEDWLWYRWVDGCVSGMLIVRLLSWVERRPA